jgi:hypothetical protein
MSPTDGDRRHSADRAEPVILSKLSTATCQASAFVPHRLAKEDTMRHSVVTTQLLRQARTALDEEARQAPVRQAEPEPPPEAKRSPLVSVARRARALALAVRTRAARVT